MEYMKKKPLFGILLNLAIIIFLAWATIHFGNKLASAKEEIEVIRNGFQTLMCLGALGITLILQQLQGMANK